MKPPAVQAVLETSLYVTDVERAVRFYRDVLGFRVLDEFDPQKGAALAAGPSVVLLFRAEVTRQQVDPPPHGSQGAGHVAFRVRPQEIPVWREYLQARGVPIEMEHRFGEHPPSLYFRDPDGNSLEIAVAEIWPW